MFTGPVGPVEVIFNWPEAIFGNFYWPGAIGLLLASTLQNKQSYVNLNWRQAVTALVYLFPPLLTQPYLYRIAAEHKSPLTSPRSTQ